MEDIDTLPFAAQSDKDNLEKVIEQGFFEEQANEIYESLKLFTWYQADDDMFVVKNLCHKV